MTTRRPIQLMIALMTATTVASSPAIGSVIDAGALPQPDHVVVVIEENHSYADVLGPTSPATYLRSLAAAGACFTQSFAIEHPSEPNYLDLFSGHNQGTADSDDYPTGTPFTTPNLGAQLIAAGFSFAGYSQGLPEVGSTIEYAGDYQHKHNPWSNWQSPTPGENQLLPSTNQPFTNFPTDFSLLPTVSFVVPDQMNDMHDGTIEQADQWLQLNIESFRTWADTHNSLLIVTFDEDDFTDVNQIATVMVGPMIVPGLYSERIDHFTVLRTLEAMYGLPGIGAAASVAPIADVFIPEPTAGALMLVASSVVVARRSRAGRAS